MVVVEPVVSREKLSQLLAEQHESPELDYKATADLSVKADEIELAKDVGAMMSAGGFIVVGARDDGSPSGKLTEAQSNLLDEARLRPKLRKYLPDPIEIRVGRHTLPTGERMALIYVGPHPDGFAIFRSDGQYQMASSKEIRVVFRAGDIFVRHGSSSEKWNQGDVGRLIERRVTAAKESWRAELASSLKPTSGLKVEISWQLDADTFRSAVIEALRQDDAVGLIQLVDDMAKAFFEALSAGRADEIELIFDRLMCLSATETALGKLRPDRRTALEPTRLYLESRDPRKSQPVLERQIGLLAAVRAVALGGLATRRADWKTVRTLAGVRMPQPNQSPYFLRNTQVEGAQADVLGIKSGQGVSLISLAVEYSNVNEWMRPGLPAGSEQVLDSICQFDLLAALVAMADSGDFSPNVYWPDFAAYYSKRSEPSVTQLISDGTIREAVFPWGDSVLGRALREIDRVARSEYFLRFGVWDGFTDPRIRELISRVRD